MRIGTCIHVYTHLHPNTPIWNITPLHTPVRSPIHRYTPLDASTFNDKLYVSPISPLRVPVALSSRLARKGLEAREPGLR